MSTLSVVCGDDFVYQSNQPSMIQFESKCWTFIRNFFFLQSESRVFISWLRLRSFSEKQDLEKSVVFLFGNCRVKIVSPVTEVDGHKHIFHSLDSFAYICLLFWIPFERYRLDFGQVIVHCARSFNIVNLYWRKHVVYVYALNWTLINNSMPFCMNRQSHWLSCFGQHNSVQHENDNNNHNNNNNGHHIVQ